MTAYFGGGWYDQSKEDIFRQPGVLAKIKQFEELARADAVTFKFPIAAGEKFYAPAPCYTCLLFHYPVKGIAVDNDEEANGVHERTFPGCEQPFTQRRWTKFSSSPARSSTQAQSCATIPAAARTGALSRTHSPRDVTPEDCVASRAGRPKGSEEGFRRPPHPFRPCSSARSVGNVPRASHLIHSAIDVENIDRQRAHRNVARQPDRPPRPETRSGPSPPPEPRPQYVSGGIEYITYCGGPPRVADLGRFVVPMEARNADFTASAAAVGDVLNPPQWPKEPVPRNHLLQRDTFTTADSATLERVHRV